MIHTESYVDTLMRDLFKSNEGPIKLHSSGSDNFVITNSLYPDFKIEGKSFEEVESKFKKFLLDRSITDIDKFFGILR